MRSARTSVVVVLITLATAFRVVPYILARFGVLSVTDFSASLWNMAPIGALCLFCGAKISNRWLALGIPLAALLISDLLIGLAMNHMQYYALDRTRGVVLACFVAMAWLGTTVPARASVGRIAATALGAEVLFYLVTNFAFWALTDWYPHTAYGLWQNYVFALPFFGRSLLGMACWGTVFFGGLAVVERRFAASARPSAV